VGGDICTMLPPPQAEERLKFCWEKELMKSEMNEYLEIFCNLL
jgi:hypothetical protein